MARYLKRWESPRHEGRNDKGKGGTARQRQLKKRNQMLRKKLQGEADAGNQDQGGRDAKSLPFLLALWEISTNFWHYSQRKLNVSPWFDQRWLYSISL
jgi:hypothetical protein